MSKEAMTLAIKTLLWANKEINNWRDDAYGHDPEDYPEIMLAIKALEEALAKQEQGEPVAWVCNGVDNTHDIDFDEKDVNALPVGTMLYTAPQRTWVGLTDDDIERGCNSSWVDRQAFESAAWWAEAKLKEKNT